jgi:hypothetical protein
MDWSPHDSGEVMFAYPESVPPHQFQKTGTMVVWNRPQRMYPTMVIHEMLVYAISGYSLTMLEQGSSNETATDGMHPML